MEKDKLQIALEAIDDLQAGSAKLASMYEEAAKKILSPGEEAQLRQINLQIADKLAACGGLEAGMTRDMAVEALMHPLTLAQFTLGTLSRDENKTASDPMTLGRPDQRKQGSQTAPATPVVTTHRRSVRC